MSYKIFMNNGAGGLIFNEVDQLIVENNPSLRQYNITFTAVVGTAPTYVFYIQAWN
jgi:hypothetical protein